MGAKPGVSTFPKTQLTGAMLSSSGNIKSEPTSPAWRMWSAPCKKSSTSCARRPCVSDNTHILTLEVIAYRPACLFNARCEIEVLLPQDELKVYIPQTEESQFACLLTKPSKIKYPIPLFGKATKTFPKHKKMLTLRSSPQYDTHQYDRTSEKPTGRRNFLKQPPSQSRSYQWFSHNSKRHFSRV